jgi:hypothetical protein
VRRRSRSAPASGGFPAGGTDTSRRWAVTLPLLAGILLVVAYAAHAARFADYLNDDAYITFRYSANLATGRGPYFNPGEHVEGYTNLSLMLVMAVVHAVAGESAVPPAAKVLGAAAAAATLLLCLGIARRLAPAAELSEREGLIWGLLAGGLVAASPGFVVNSLSGLETALLAACLCAAIWCDSGPRPSVAGTATWLSLAVLTRPEGILVAGVYLATRLVDAGPAGSRADRVRVAAAVALVFAARLLARVLLYDGELLPNTYHAKAGGFWGTGAWEYVREGALVPLLGLAGAALALLGWLAPGRSRRAVMPLAATALAGAALPFATGTDWMIGWRYSAPYLPLLALAVTFGWVRLTGLGARRREAVATALLVTLPLAWLLQSPTRRTLSDYVEVKAVGYRNGHAAVARWLCGDAAAEGGVLAPGDRIALMDIGLIAYRCAEMRVVDITGLTDRFIARSPGEFLQKEYDPAYVLDQRPEAIVLAYVMGGDPRQLPSGDEPVYAWSRIESRLAAEPFFERHYRRPPGASAGAPTWSDRVAARLGAARVFLHDDPGVRYLLAVYLGSAKD